MGGAFYGIGQGATQKLFRIDNGSATQIAVLPDLGGGYAGLAYAHDISPFYALIVNATSGATPGDDYLVSFHAGGSNLQTLADLTALDGAQQGAHLGGLAYGGAGVLYSIYTGFASSTGQLEQISVGAASATSRWSCYDRPGL